MAKLNNNGSPLNAMVVAVYFGKLPPYFQLWLDSVGENPSVRWLFCSDIDLSFFVLPKNITIKHISFEGVRSLARRKLGFEPDLHCPYDLCKFRVAYGKIFEDDLKGVDYWAWTDCDMLYGDLTSVIAECEKGFDKVLPKGHLSFVKNDGELTRGILLDDKIHSILKDGEVVSSSGCVDEVEIRFEVLPKLGASQMNDLPYVNFYPRYGHFRLQDATPLCKKLGYAENPHPSLPVPCVFTWKDGHLLGWFALPNRKIQVVECVYIHFFKRDLSLTPKSLRKGVPYLILPNKMIEFDGHDLSWGEIARLDRKRIHWRYFLKRLTIRNLIRKVI